MYWSNNCSISLAGASGKGFNISAGVRQGCPLSPLIFAIISDVLLRRISRLLPHTILRAYADDLAMVLPRGHQELCTLEKIFTEYMCVSRLRLHHGKSVWISLSGKPHAKVREDISRCAPAWSGFTIADRAKYLGFMMGPARQSHSWTSALQKMQDRAKLWRAIGGGIMVGMCAYRMYIFPLASFLIQLEGLPSNWEAIERSLCNTLFPGPRGWATPAVLGQLVMLGFPMELTDAHATSLGAKCRVYWWENAGNGGLNIGLRARALQRIVDASRWASRRTTWKDWVQNNFLLNVSEAYDQLNSKAANSRLTVDQLLRGSRDQEVPREQWQKRCSVLLRTRQSDQVSRHLRRRLDRWPLQILPGRRIYRAMDMLKGISKLVSPCIWAAVLKALFDGWTTHRRMQRASPCLFGCGRGEDSIHHYSFCPEVADLARNRLGLCIHGHHDRLDRFLVLAPRFSIANGPELARRALVVYATFKATNAVRHGQATHASAAWIQAFKEGAASHPALSNLVARNRHPTPSN